MKAKFVAIKMEQHHLSNRLVFNMSKEFLYLRMIKPSVHQS